MRTLTIKNIGPIKSISIDLKRINVLIGLQSSGKSTINKIACYCSWVEKEIYINQSAESFFQNSYFEKNLITFHKLEGFISKDTLIQYETDNMIFTYSKAKNKFDFEWKQNDYWWKYKRIKTLYIPAERNIVAVIPNWFDIKLDFSNLRSFMSDWQEARNFYSNTTIPILNLGVKYSYNAEKGTDEIYLSDSNKKIDFRNASSGLQSLIPLCTLTDYITKNIFSEQNKDSIQYDNLKKQLRLHIQALALKDITTLDKVYLEKQIEIDNTNYKFKLKDWEFELNTKQRQHTLEFILNNVENVQQSNIFLEEPEVNLFPITQRELLQFLIKTIYHNEEGREHSLFLTTHSPYILTTLNNLIYASECGVNNKSKTEKVITSNYWVNFNDVGVWFVKNGNIECILDSDEKQIDANKIDEVSQLLNEEFDNLLNIQYSEV